MPKLKQTKTARICAMLGNPDGASLDTICKDTGWQRHSARAMISTLRKKGVLIEHRKATTDGAPATYHILMRPEVSK